MKKKVFICIDWFYPAFRAGGPISSIVNLIDHLHKEFDFYVLCGGSDFGSEVDLDSIELNTWTNYKNIANVFYVSKDKLYRSNIVSILNETPCDYYYIQGMFSKCFSLYPLLWWKQFAVGQLIVAPRGMLHSTALRIKYVKKKIYLNAVKIMGWYNNVYFHATDEAEATEIKNNFSKYAKIKVASMLPKILEINTEVLAKNKNELNVICISRISEEKNILFFVKALSQLQIPIKVGFIGPYEDKKYFEKFIYKLSILPDNISYKYYGHIKPNKIHTIMQKYHLLVHPSKGENYGHAIVESLTLGMPVIAGSNIPWNNLEEFKSGFNIDLNEKDLQEKLELYYAMEVEEFKEQQQAAIKYIESNICIDELKQKYRNIFN